MTGGIRTRSALAASALAFAMALCRSGTANAEIPLVQYDGWQLSTDGRVNAFASVAEGNGLPDEPENLGAGTADAQTSTGSLHSTRIRNGFLMSILGFTGLKEVSPNFKVTTRIALWMNISGTRTKNIPALVDPREVYGRIEGGWGSIQGGSQLALFGRGGIGVDFAIAHDYGLGYPCSIRDASGGACGMSGFGAPFPGFEPGFVYATPRLGGFQLSLGAFDPATIGNAQLARAPTPRLEGEATFAFREIFRLFANGFWQAVEGTVPDAALPGGQKDLHSDTWGAQVGAMIAAGPVMVGGAAFEGLGFSPITNLEESVITADSAGVLRKARGGFALAAVVIERLKLKIAGGAGLWHLDKNKDDAPALVPQMDGTNAPSDPHLIKQNFGVTAGLYQTTGPVHFALEYFRAEHTWYDRGVPSATDPSVATGVTTPRQVVNFINLGMTIAW